MSDATGTHPAPPLTVAPFVSKSATNGMVASVDHLASEAGVWLLRNGGSAADAAVGASAVLAVVAQHTCGMGGDLWALVHHGSEHPVAALNASGRAGSGASAQHLRARGFAEMPFTGDIASVTVPGCVDGWLQLHDRFGCLPLAEVLAPAIEAARRGFALSPKCAAAVAALQGVAHANDYTAHATAGLIDGLPAGTVVTRPGVADALERIVSDGRDGFYGGPFGADLLALGDGLFADGDLERPGADWVEPVGVEAFGHQVWTMPPNSQGYLITTSAWIADRLPVAEHDPGSAAWVHLLAEAAKQAAFDRPSVLFEGASAEQLCDPERLKPRLAAISAGRASQPAKPAVALSSEGDTCYLAAVDSNRMGVSLIASNANGWGAGIFTPTDRISLHNRGIGFSLEAGHPAEFGPGRRPPHTLAPAIVSGTDGTLALVLGTMGGDAQPQVVLQLLARMLLHGASPAEAVGAGRWRWGSKGAGGFGTWTATATDYNAIAGNSAGAAAGTAAEQSNLRLLLEGHGEVGLPPPADDSTAQQLTQLGHEVRRLAAFDDGFGHAHAIAVTPQVLTGAADPRALTSAVVGY